MGALLKSNMKYDGGVVVGSLQNATRALWFTDALLWNFPSTKPFLGRSEQRPAQTFPGDQLWTDRQIMCLRAGRMLGGGAKQYFEAILFANVHGELCVSAHIWK